MARIIVHGRSADLIEVDGDIEAEFYSFDEVRSILAFSDGTLLEARYAPEGHWRICALARGSADLDKESDTHGAVEGTASERVVLEGDIRWIASGREYIVV